MFHLNQNNTNAHLPFETIQAVANHILTQPSKARWLLMDDTRNPPFGNAHISLTTLSVFCEKESWEVRSEGDIYAFVSYKDNTTRRYNTRQEVIDQISTRCPLCTAYTPLLACIERKR